MFITEAYPDATLFYTSCTLESGNRWEYIVIHLNLCYLYGTEQIYWSTNANYERYLWYVYIQNNYNFALFSLGAVVNLYPFVSKLLFRNFLGTVWSSSFDLVIICCVCPSEPSGGLAQWPLNISLKKNGL